MGEWFRLERFDDGIRQITEPAIHALLRCNVWHVEGRERDLVIDASLGLQPLAPVLDTDRRLTAVATHTHSDHVGSLHEFAERLCHPAEAPNLEQPIPVSLRTADYPPEVVDPYREAGYAFGDVLVDPLPEGCALVYTCPAAPATALLREGDVVDLGDRAFEVLHLPGHSPGSMGLWEAATGTLFSGDAIYDGPLLDRLEESDIGDYVVTLQRLRELPVTVVHGGHEPSFGRERLVELCNAQLARWGER